MSLKKEDLTNRMNKISFELTMDSCRTKPTSKAVSGAEIERCMRLLGRRRNTAIKGMIKSVNFKGVSVILEQDSRT